MSKKIILLIVEGINEDISLRGILSEIFNDKKIEFCLVRTDITTREDIKPNNIKKYLGWLSPRSNKIMTQYLGDKNSIGN